LITKIFNSGNTQRNNAGKLDLHHVLEQLAQQNINSVLLESGPKLIGAMVEAGLVDEFILYPAPLLMGSNATSMIQLIIVLSIPAIENFGISSIGKYLERGISYLVFAINNNTQWYTINASGDCYA
jgi:riboflavin biosynthesis pyrimidine reductase